MAVTPTRARCVPTSPIRLIVLFATFLAAVAAMAAARAETAPAGVPRPVALDDVGQGSLLLRTSTPGRFIPAPLILTEVRMRVSGMVARVELRQQFHNPSGSWLEGLYAFPLPENSAVDRMRLQVGEDVIEARIAEREAARRRFEQARQEGRRAALIEQHRPNIFTNEVTNIAPGETVTVELRYQQTLRYDQGRFALRFPMVVGPRYNPGPLTVVRTGADGWGQADPAANEPPPDPPVLPPENGRINPVTIEVALDAGFPLAELTSPYHAIKAGDWTGGKATITLDDGAVPADRDFELVWKPAVGAAPAAGAFREIIGDDAYLVAMVLPPERATGPIPPRDIVFVLDRSGSMGGTSIVQARAAIGAALARLRPVDRFNVIRFDHRHDMLFADAVPADATNIARAQDYVRGTQAEGGTEMMPALVQALSGTAAPGRLRQVVFLTDGAVGNEAALLAEIERRIGQTRLFTVGIGSAPNSYFMSTAAQAGRGAFTYIGKLDEVAAKMQALFAKLERPAVTDLRVRWSAGGRDIATVSSYPELPPDLYYGEPVMLAAKLTAADANAADATLHIEGIHGDTQWRQALALSGAAPGAGIGSVWGRARIADLTGSLRRGGDHESVRKAVIETALRHGLVSRYTSLVAVHDTVARPAGADLVRSTAPINLPAGWDYDTLFGDTLLKRDRRAEAAPAAAQEAAAPPASRGAAGAARQMAAAPVMLNAASSGDAVALPQGSTPWRLQLLIGLAALVAAACLMLWRRRYGNLG